MSRILRSVVSPQEIAAIVDATYDLPGPANAKILSLGDNDHYRITAGDERFVFRLYVHRKHWEESPSDPRFELTWLAHLHGCGLPVSHPLPTRGGNLHDSLQAPEGRRNFALFSFADGDVRTLYENARYVRMLGRLIARLHSASEEFTGRPPRCIDSEFLLTKPWARVRGYLESLGRHGDIERVDRVAAEIRERIAELPRSSPAFGIIGGDFNGENQHVSAGAITLFDFDLCGCGWRAYDLAVFLCHRRRGDTPGDETADQSLIDGYCAERALGDVELRALPALVKARQLWIMGEHVADGDALGIARIGPSYWDRAVALLERV